MSAFGMTGWRGWALGLAVVAIAQTAALGWMLWDRVSLLRAPTEITLTPLPIDPRDLFRGDYVILRYAISSPPTGESGPNPTADAPGSEPDAVEPETPAPDVRGEGVATLPEGSTVWVTIVPDAETGWRIRRIEAERPEAAPADGAVVLRASTETWGAMLLSYGVEWYFVPEGEGLRLETMIGERALQVTLAVAEDGRAAIKALTVEGETVYVEPLL